jgi:heme/copper-type cytochrome/quinol oxidase subunit 4
MGTLIGVGIGGFILGVLFTCVAVLLVLSVVIPDDYL